MMTKEEAKLVLDNARPQTKEIDRQFYDDEDLNNALDMAIKALELVEEFEKAQIITGGRLNGRTYAYKCGLKDGKRKALEQQPSNEDVQRVVDYLLKPKSKPPTTSKDCVSLGVYKQVICERDIAIEQLKELGYELGEKIRTSDDCVSREQAKIDIIPNSLYTSEQVIALLDNLPPVTPTQSWILVSRELPKENGWYQCTVNLNDSLLTMELFYKNGKWLDNRRINMFDSYDIYGYGNTKEKHKLSYQELVSEFEWNQVVVAWQPLPKPYEEKRGNEE